MNLGNYRIASGIYMLFYLIYLTNAQKTVAEKCKSCNDLVENFKEV
jgi:hypothetical protein